MTPTLSKELSESVKQTIPVVHWEEVGGVVDVLIMEAALATSLGAPSSAGEGGGGGTVSNGAQKTCLKWFCTCMKRILLHLTKTSGHL